MEHKKLISQRYEGPKTLRNSRFKKKKKSLQNERQGFRKFT